MLIWIVAAHADAWDEVLARHVRGGEVDYAAVGATTLDGWIRAAATAAPSTALWINAYNAITVDVVAGAWPIGSILELDNGKVWTTRHFTVAGRDLTLDGIENGVLRPLGDPRVHAALVCAARGCPPLRGKAYTSAGLDAELEEAARAWVATTAWKRQGETLVLSRIFEWYAADFPGGPLPFLRRYASGADREWLAVEGRKTTWADYDWSVNAPR